MLTKARKDEEPRSRSEKARRHRCEAVQSLAVVLEERAPGKGRAGNPPPSPKGDRPGVITVPSEDGTGGETEDLEALNPAGRDRLRSILKNTRERILDGTTGRSRRVHFAPDVLVDKVEAIQNVQRETSLVAGTHLIPGRQTPFQLSPTPVDSNGPDMRTSKKRTAGTEDAASSLLAQSAQQTTLAVEKRCKKKKDKDKKSGITQLVNLLQGKKKKKKKKRREEKRRRARRESSRVKPDPDDPNPSDSSDYGSSSSSSGSGQAGDDSAKESDLSMEAPLKKRAIKSRGSVMKMLVRHAQEQLDLDQGSMVELPR